MLSTKEGIYLKIIEWILFFGLCGLSAVFLWGVLDKFNSRKTSFTQSEEPIQDLPTIAICFSKPDSRKTEYKYEQDFKIEYKILLGNQSLYGINFLKEGKKSTALGEIIYLQKMVTRYLGDCYKISSILSDHQLIKYGTRIFLHFNKSIVDEDLPPFIKLFFTSEKNSHGIIESQWRNGKIIRSQVNKDMGKVINLTPQQHNFLTINSKCSSESYYECLEKRLNTTLNCSLVSLPILPLCEMNKTNVTEKVFWDQMAKVKDVLQCPKLCKILEYSGDEQYYQNLSYTGHGEKIITFP